MRPYLLTFLIIQVLCSFVPLINETNGQECPIPSLGHGSVRPRNHGRSIKYQCMRGYELMGQRYATCIYGRWDTETPLCIRPGCKPMSLIENGLMIYMRKNSVAMVFCNPGFVLEGSSLLYCDGVKWNTTQPSCSATPGIMPALNCDFELPDICGWKHDPLHDFDWRRQNKNTPSGHIGTGPSYDHTLGSGKTGFYMYIESSSRLENDTARLLSPIYPANLTQNGCFVFYYHMFGRHIGSLQVIVRPESADLQGLVHDADLRMKYTLFEKSGNQGNVWYRGFFDLDVLNEDFQIVIEGVRGTGYVSDIAIDDVALLQGEECVRQKEIHFSSTPLPLTTRDSCLNRCNQPSDVQVYGAECHCYESCVYDFTCCVDYADMCVFGDTDSTNVDESTTPAYVETTSVPPPLPPSLKMTATNTPDQNPGYTNATRKASTTTDMAQTTSTTQVYKKYYPIKPVPVVPVVNKTTNTLPTVIYTKTKTETTRIPRLQFVTTSLPFINATRVLNKTDTPTRQFNASGSKEFVRPSSNDSKAKFIPGSTLVVGETTTTKYVSKPSTDIRYGTTTESKKLANDSDFGVVTDKIIVGSANNGKMIYYKQDPSGRVKISPSSTGLSTSFITVILLLVIAMVAALVYAVKRGAATKLVDQYTKLRLRTASQNSSDNMRFLVQEEELEHEYDAL